MKNQLEIEYLSEDLLEVSSKQKSENYKIRIEFDIAYWFIENLNPACPIYVFNKKIEQRTLLKKYDVINIGNRKFYWSNHIIEKDQELTLRDLLRYRGRVNPSNFKFFIPFYVGVGICLMFVAPLIPEFLFDYLPNISNRRFRRPLIEILTPQQKYNISMILYVITYSALILAFVFLIIKRVRDYKAEKAFIKGKRML